MSEKEKSLNKKGIKALWENKRMRSILLSVGVILVCAVVYVVLLLTLLAPEEEEVLPTVGNHGEEMSGARPFIVDPVELNQIQSIRVDNDLGGFHFYRAEDKEFYFEGAEHMLYDSQSDFAGEENEDVKDVLSGFSAVDALYSLVRYMLSDEEVVGYNKDLSVYGLNDGGKASLTLTYLDDDGNEVIEKVIFGNKTVSGSSYYCMVEGREAVYVLYDNYVTRCVFSDVKDYFSPLVAIPISNAQHTEVSKLEIKKKGETFISLRAMTAEEMKAQGMGDGSDLNSQVSMSQIFDTPAGYYPSPETLPEMLLTFTDFTGEQVVEFGITQRLSDPEKAEEMYKLFRHYSLMDQNNQWTYELSYLYDSIKYDTKLYISEKLEVEGSAEGEKEEIYYVYSPDFDLIVEFKAEDLFWVEWDVLHFMDNRAYSVFIDRVSTMEFTYEKTDVKFSLQGEGSELKVSCSSGANINVEDFRELYKAIVYSTLDGYADKTEGSEEILRIKITLRDGEVYEYVFYGLTARKAYYSLNGSTQFYVNRDYVKQIVNTCTAVLKGESVKVEHKN